MRGVVLGVEGVLLFESGDGIFCERSAVWRSWNVVMMGAQSVTAFHAAGVLCDVFARRLITSW